MLPLFVTPELGLTGAGCGGDGLGGRAWLEDTALRRFRRGRCVRHSAASRARWRRHRCRKTRTHPDSFAQGLPPSRFSRFGEPRRSSPASTASGGGKARATSVRPYLPYLTYPTYLTYQTHPTYATYATYLACSDVVFLSSSVFGGFGGRGRFIVRLTPFQKGSTFRSIS